MANENALKIAFQKNAPASRVLAFEGGFCGRTLALSQITDRPAYRDGLPPTLAVDYVPFFDPGDPPGSTDRALGALRSHLSRHPAQHAAMVLELVLGEGGFYPGDRGHHPVHHASAGHLRTGPAKGTALLSRLRLRGRSASPLRPWPPEG
jgi:4-aminobutyrate aminotransferase-like enzyme